ncbi:MAG: beta-lactamase domain protein [Gemmatimonadetes bacterium]|nr:beta-lactamase domain protein [Gemmatimonadota bacterium]
MTLRIEQVESGVQRLALSNWQGRRAGYEVSAFLMRGVLVDTGFPRVGRELVRAVRALSPRAAIVTHWHEDHSGNAPALVEMGIPMMMHPACEATLRERPDIAFYRRSIWGRPHRLTSAVTPFDPAPLQIIATPGHTKDHQIVWDADRGIVASGDLFLGVKVRVAHAHESPSTLLASLRTVVALEPRLLLDAHRGVVENPVPVLRAKISWIEETIGEIRRLAASGAGEREVQRRVLGAESLVGWVSLREYSKLSLVRTVLRETTSLTWSL